MNVLKRQKKCHASRYQEGGNSPITVPKQSPHDGVEHEHTEVEPGYETHSIFFLDPDVSTVIQAD